MTVHSFVRIARAHALPPANRSERIAKVASQRQLAFKSPPMTAEERRAALLAIDRQRRRDHGEVGLFE